MRLACPNCGACYDVADAAIPVAGRELECSACGHIWFHRRATAEPATRSAPEVPPSQPAAAEPAPTPAPAPAAPPTQSPRPTDPGVLQILREEAVRELEARRLEAAGTRPPGAAAPPADTAPPRRALLPDIDEVSPTLRPEGAVAGQGGVVLEERKPRRRGFAVGFFLILALSALAVAAYLFAEEIARAVPTLAAAMDDYVAAVDRLRRAVQSLLQ